MNIDLIRKYLCLFLSRCAVPSSVMPHNQLVRMLTCCEIPSGVLRVLGPD